MELELGHQNFPAYFRDAYGSHNNRPGFYLLAKDMAFDVIRDRKKHLTERLMTTQNVDLVAFADSLRVGDHGSYKALFTDDPQGFGLLLILRDIGDPKIALEDPLWLSDHVMIRKSDTGSDFVMWSFKCTHGGTEEGHNTAAERLLWNTILWGRDPVRGFELVVSELTQSGVQSTTSLDDMDPGKWHRAWNEHVVDDGKKKVTADLWNLSKTKEVNVTEFKLKKKSTVARFLAKTIEGGEVVEIDNVTSTSMLMNTCYDMPLAQLVPYACLGLGVSFVSVSNSDPLPKLAYKLKLGVSAQVAPNVFAFAGGYYHQVVSGIKDMELPVLRLIDDYSPDGRTKDAALASFDLAYSGCEVGLNFVF